MFNMNELFKDALKPTSVGDALQICADALGRRGVDSTLARSIVEDILNFSQFRTFSFSPKDFDMVVEGKLRPTEMIASRLKNLIPFFQHQAKAVCGLNQDEEKKVGDMLKLSLEVFFEDPEFAKSIDGVMDKLKPILRDLKDGRNRDT